jgi:tetratricopeptide (TPR) repeat protein
MCAVMLLCTACAPLGCTASRQPAFSPQAAREALMQGATDDGAPPARRDTTTTYALDESGNWSTSQAPEPGSDEAVLALARQQIAQGRPGRAFGTIDEWLSPRERTDHPLLAQAFLLRADARSADGDEYQALYDYEAVIKNFPGAPEYVTALERELDIGVKYVNGTRRKMLGMRIVEAEAVGEELLLRIHERLPGSRLAERAGIELADHYYRTRDLDSAAVAYELFQANNPRSAYAMRARQRQIFSNLGRFKGPRYDSTKLTDTRLLIERFQRDYPAQAEQLGLDETLSARVDESAAEQWLDAADWHVRRDDPAAARLVLARLVRAHPQSAAAQRALALMESRGWSMPGPASTTPTPLLIDPPADAEANP